MRERSAWTLHLASSGVILILLTVHMGLMHLSSTLGLLPAGQSPLDWATVVERMRSVLFSVTYVALLGAALYHGLYGLRNIVFELGPSASLRRATNIVLVVGGLALFVFGAWAAIASVGAGVSFGG